MAQTSTDSVTIGAVSGSHRGAPNALAGVLVAWLILSYSRWLLLL
ncbi:MAG: hypothetical protein U1E47_08400 [Rivihabitans pingtungensis]